MKWCDELFEASAPSTSTGSEVAVSSLSPSASSASLATDETPPPSIAAAKASLRKHYGRRALERPKKRKGIGWSCGGPGCGPSHWSLGSRNHPSGQCTPCLARLSPGGCPRGQQCDLCHHDHGDAARQFEAAAFSAAANACSDMRKWPEIVDHLMGETASSRASQHTRTPSHGSTASSSCHSSSFLGSSSRGLASEPAEQVGHPQFAHEWLPQWGAAGIAHHAPGAQAAPSHFGAWAGETSSGMSTPRLEHLAGTPERQAPFSQAPRQGLLLRSIPADREVHWELSMEAPDASPELGPGRGAESAMEAPHLGLPLRSLPSEGEVHWEPGMPTPEASPNLGPRGPCRDVDDAGEATWLLLPVAVWPLPEPAASDGREWLQPCSYNGPMQ